MYLLFVDLYSDLSDSYDSIIYYFRLRREQIYKGPRTVFFKKTETGFGFNVRGQVSEGGM